MNKSFDLKVTAMGSIDGDRFGLAVIGVSIVLLTNLENGERRQKKNIQIFDASACECQVNGCLFGIESCRWLMFVALADLIGCSSVDDES